MTIVNNKKIDGWTNPNQLNKGNCANIINGIVVKNVIKHQSPAIPLVAHSKKIGPLIINEITPQVSPSFNQSCLGASPQKLYHLKVEDKRAKTNDQMKGVRNGAKKKTHRRTNYQHFKAGISRNESWGYLPRAWD